MSGLRRINETKPSRTTVWSSAMRTPMRDFLGVGFALRGLGRAELAAERVRVAAATGPD
jgi:hypothetical protein